MGVAREKVIEQVVTPRKPRARTLSARQTPVPGLMESAKRFQRWLVVVPYALGLVVLVWAGRAAIRSPLFAPTRFEVSGNERLSKVELERAVRQAAGASLLTASLDDIRTSVESVTWVKHARVTRVLPDTIRLLVEERKPLLPARIEDNQALVWMDEEGVVLGGYEANAADNPSLPVAVGFASDRSEKGREENRERIDTYKKLMWALDSGTPKYSERLESIDLTRIDDVTVHLTAGRILVQLGDSDFRTRLVRALEVLDVIQRRDGEALQRLQITDPRVLQFADRIKSISVVHPVQVSLELNGALPATSAKPEATGKKPVAGKPAASQPPTRRKNKP